MGRGWGLIGDPPDREGSRWPGIAAAAKTLKEFGHPDELDRKADRLESSPDELERASALRVRGNAQETKHALGLVRAVGYSFDFDKGVLKFPASGPGRCRGLAREAVAAAFEELGGKDRDQWYDRETLAEIRSRLSEYFPPEELTDALIKMRLQRHLSS
jgi:hypothetical protein